MEKYWAYIVVCLCGVLLVFMLVKEVKRTNRRWVVARVIASVLGIASFACLAVDITYQRRYTTTNDRAVLVTKNFREDSLVAMYYSGATVKIYYVDEKLNVPAMFSPRYLASLSWLTDSLPEGTPLHIYGEGLSSDALSTLENRPIVFHASTQPGGISHINWPATSALGARLHVQGKFVNAFSYPVKLVLKGFDVGVDSTVVAANQTANFSFSTLPKHTGKAVYHIIGLNNRDTVCAEPVPVEVMPAMAPQLLMLTASPGFDNNFLKNWLADKGFGIASRTTISKNKNSTSFVNTASMSLERVTTALLEKFDGVIMDAAAYRGLPSAERNVLLNRVDQQGLGLLIKADSSIGASLLNRMFPVVAAEHATVQQVKLSFVDTAQQLPALGIERPVHLRTVAGTQPLLVSHQQQAFAGTLLYGKGKIVVTTLGNTYQWMLAGRKQAYNQLWSAMLNKVVKTKLMEEQWSAPALTWANEPAMMSVQTAPGVVPAGVVGGHSFYLQQLTFEPSTWTGKFWPVQSGWQTGVQHNGGAFSWFVFAHNQYELVRAVKRATATRSYALHHQPTMVPTAVTSAASRKVVPRYWFVLFFVACCTFLWIERKWL